MNYNQVPQGGSQEIKPTPFSTSKLTEVLNGDIKPFLTFLDAVSARKGELGQWSNSERYRLGQFTTNRSRIGILGSSTIPGIRKVATDYAANAYQTMVNEDTLRVLCEEAGKVLESKPASKPKQSSKEGKGHRRLATDQNTTASTPPTTQQEHDHGQAHRSSIDIQPGRTLD